MKENKINQNGRSMVEMLGVLAVIGVISAGGFAMVDKMQTTYEDNRVVDDFSSISQKIHPVFREYYSGDGDFGTYIKNAFAKSEITFTESSDKTSATTTGQSGKTFTVARTGTSSYTISVSDLTESSCMQVATTRWERMQSLKINDNTKDANSSAAAFAAGEGGCAEGSTITITFN